AVILSTDLMLPPSAFDPQRFGLATGMGAGGIRPVTTQGFANGPAARAESTDGMITLDTLNIAEVERVLIEKALKETGNNRTRAAELLGMSVRTLRNKLNSPGGDGEDEG